jgi:hypothetical protein
MMEGVLARGDRKLADAIEAAYKKGCIYDAWGDYFHYDKWLETFDELGIDMYFYTSRVRKEDEIFPWDFLGCGVSKKFLYREWQNAQAGKVTPNCRMNCSGCGALSYGVGVCKEPKTGEAVHD